MPAVLEDPLRYFLLWSSTFGRVPGSAPTMVPISCWCIPEPSTQGTGCLLRFLPEPSFCLPNGMTQVGGRQRIRMRRRCFRKERRCICRLLVQNQSGVSDQFIADLVPDRSIRIGREAAALVCHGSFAQTDTTGLEQILITGGSRADRVDGPSP